MYLFVIAAGQTHAGTIIHPPNMKCTLTLGIKISLKRLQGHAIIHLSCPSEDEQHTSMLDINAGSTPL